MAIYNDQDVTSAVRSYEQQYRGKFEMAAKSVRDQLDEELKKVPLRFSTSFRAKDGKSLGRKLIKEGLGDSKIEDWLPRNGLSKDKGPKVIKDLAGVRVSLYFPSDWPFVEGIIFKSFNNVRVKLHPQQPPTKSEREEEEPYTKSERQQFDGYIARHYWVDTKYNYRVEIQVATAMMHAWLEAEHELIYKEQEGEDPLKAHELGTIDGLNGLALAGDTILNGLKVQLLERGRFEYATQPDRFQASVVERSEKEFTLIGQNLYRTMVGEGPEQQQQAVGFKDQLIEHLCTKKDLNVFIIVGNPENKQQMKRFGYGFPRFKQNLKASINALRALQNRAKEKGVGDRLHWGTHEKIPLDSLSLSDPDSEDGVAYLTYTSLGSKSDHRAIRMIEKRKHEDHFNSIVTEDYAWRYSPEPL